MNLWCVVVVVRSHWPQYPIVEIKDSETIVANWPSKNKSRKNYLVAVYLLHSHFALLLRILAVFVWGFFFLLFVLRLYYIFGEFQFFFCNMFMALKKSKTTILCIEQTYRQRQTHAFTQSEWMSERVSEW